MRSIRRRAPPTAGDALYYHLALPKQWLAAHELTFVPDHEKSTFPLLVEAVSCLFKSERPDLSWITQHESLLVSSTP